MQTKLSMLALCCALVAACSGDDAIGDNQNPNQAGRGGRGPDFDDLIDAASGDSGELIGHGDGGGGAGGSTPADGGEITPDGGDITPTDGGDLPDPADGSVTPGEPPVVADDPGTRGPWPVGVRTSLIPITSVNVPAEIWYPAKRGTEAGKTEEVYDFIKWLPPEAQADVAAVDKPVPVICHDCYRDLPIDEANGPFPVVVFVHNFGVFRTGSANLMAHWASRGFVVVALDHARLHLQDILAYTSLFGTCTPAGGLVEDTTLKRDVAALLDMLRAPKDDFAFLSGALDTTKMAVAGHGDGADYAARASGQAGVRLILQLNHSVDVAVAGDVTSVAYITGGNDGTSYGRTSAALAAYNDATVPAAFASLDTAGHLSATELCNAKSSAGRDGMQIGRLYRLCNLDYDILELGWDCSNLLLDQPTANERFGYATVAALEQFLKGKNRAAAWSKIAADWGDGRSKSE
jgi:predicted dienelactone hydrolase